jgi:hypothetical protein
MSHHDHITLNRSLIEATQIRVMITQGSKESLVSLYERGGVIHNETFEELVALPANTIAFVNHGKINNPGESTYSGLHTDLITAIAGPLRMLKREYFRNCNYEVIYSFHRVPSVPDYAIVSFSLTTVIMTDDLALEIANSLFTHLSSAKLKEITFKLEYA